MRENGGKSAKKLNSLPTLFYLGVSDIPGVKESAEVDLQGRRAGTLCLFHPDVRAFWSGLAADLCKSYDIDGILFFNERNGPLLNALAASHAQSIASSRVTCFCEFHQQAVQQSPLELRQGSRTE